jgi:hypothetical protein
MNIFEQIIQPEITWFKAHERFLLFVVVFGALLIGHYKVINYLSDRDKAKSDKADAVLQQQVVSNQQLAAQSATDAANYKQLLDQILPQIQALQNSIQARNTTTSTQQKVDAGLSGDQLATRIVTLAPGGTVLAKTDNTYLLDRPEAVVVAQKLEMVEPLQLNVNSLNEIVQDRVKQTVELTDTNVDLTKQVTGLNQQIVDKDKACKLDIKTAVDVEKKKHRKWDLFFYGLGLVTKAIVTGRF